MAEASTTAPSHTTEQEALDVCDVLYNYWRRRAGSLVDSFFVESRECSWIVVTASKGNVLKGVTSSLIVIWTSISRPKPFVPILRIIHGEKTVFYSALIILKESI